MKKQTYAEPHTHMDTDGITVVILNYRTPELVVECLESVKLAREFLSGLPLIVLGGGIGDGLPVGPEV